MIEIFYSEKSTLNVNKIDFYFLSNTFNNLVCCINIFYIFYKHTTIGSKHIEQLSYNNHWNQLYINWIWSFVKYLTKTIDYLYSNFNADSENMNNGLSNSMGRGSNRPRGTSNRGRGSRHDFFTNSMYLFF